ncbi:MAG: hypothetical protein K2G27_03350 [Duncaniella sp.]|nr:hypothetical protein [Duncaniella sp.]
MSKVLFLFEGDKLEPGLFEATLPLIASDSNFVRDGNGIVCIYGTHIYTLYSKLKADDGLDLVGELIRNIDSYPQLREVLRDGEIPEEAFEATYLIFDYDGHVNMPRSADGSYIDGDMALMEMLDFFDDASDNGKLLISYPMGEAIKHLSDEPTSVEDIITSKCKGPHCPNMECEHRSDKSTCPPIKVYKSIVNNLHPRRNRTENITPQEWGQIFKCHLKVAELMCDGTDHDISSQSGIFNIQLRDFISKSCPQVAVLSSFPFLYLDFIGKTALLERIDNL